MYKYILTALVACMFLTMIGCQSDSPSSAPSQSHDAIRPMTQSTQNPEILVDYPFTPWPAGTAGAININFDADISGTTAKLQLFKATNSETGAPCCADDPNVTWTKVAESGQGENWLTYSMVPTVVGNYGWKVHFIKGNSDYHNDTMIPDCMRVVPEGGSGSDNI